MHTPTYYTISIDKTHKRYGTAVSTHKEPIKLIDENVIS